MPRKGKRRKSWSYTVGQPPVQLSAVERAERGGAIYTRIWNGRAYTDRRVLCGPIRDAKGEIVPALENEAREAAQARQKAAVSGVVETAARELVLTGLFRKLLHSKDGKYAAATPWKRDVERFSKVICRALGGDTRVVDLRHSHYRKLWRWLAEQSVATGKYGPRAAELIVGALRSAVTWAHGDGLVEGGVGLPALHWKSQMREEWTAITKKAIQWPAKPRYTREEQAKLWSALPHADPRLRLAVALGAELRLGQLTRTRRSDVLPYGTHDIGVVTVHGRGKKHGTRLVLTDEERAVLTEALTAGYLADLEKAHARGKLPDYFLIPGHKLAKGRVRVTNAEVPWERTGMRKAWRRLEDAAGVEHVRGRNWYGLRRLHADLAEDAESDERVLDTLGGWTDSATRRSYQQEGRAEISEKAAEVRSRIRPKGTALPQNVTPAPENVG